MKTPRSHDSGEQPFYQGTSIDTFYDELDLVFKRHNEVIAARPDMAVALLVNMADTLRDKFNVHVETIPLNPEKSLVYCGQSEGESMAFIGFDRDHDTGELAETPALPEWLNLTKDGVDLSKIEFTVDIQPVDAGGDAE